MGSLVKAAIALVLALILFASVLQALAQVYKPNTYGSMQLIKSNNTSATASNVTITTTPIPSINRPAPISWYNRFPGGWASGYWPAWNSWGWPGWGGNWVTGDPYTRTASRTVLEISKYVY